VTYSAVTGEKVARKTAKSAKENLRVRAGLLVTVMSCLPGGMVGVFRVQGCGHRAIISVSEFVM
jgi:hypothetical protein